MREAGCISVLMDFDGTVTKLDTLQYLLDTFNGDNWRSIEQMVERGAMDEREALQLEMDLLDVSLEEALRELEGAIEVDPHFAAFIDWCGRRGIETTVLSGGFATIIRRILPEEVYGVRTVLANDVKVTDGRWVVVPRGNWEDCRKCNHCKRTAVLEARRAGRLTVYVGNGNTDICPAGAADMVIGRDRLAAAMKKAGRSVHEFDDFRDVKRCLLGTIKTMG